MKKESIFIQDIERVVQNTGIPWHMLDGKNVLVTGASGLLGTHLTYVLSKRNVNVFALGRNEIKLNKLPATPVVVNDITDPITIDSKIDFIIHGANPTQSGEFVKKPVDVIKSIMAGTSNVLDFARDNKVSGLVYISTLEVYGEIDRYPIFEDDLGFINLSNPRNCYPLAKRMAENLCTAYYAQYGLPVKIARLTQTFGAGVEYTDNRLFAHIARAAVEQKDIVLNTKGGTIRNYCYVSDAISALMFILLRGEPSQAYNIADRHSETSVSEIASIVAQEYGIKVAYDIKDTGGIYPPEHKTVISTTKLEKLGWKPEVSGILPMYKKLINSFMDKHE